MKKAQNTLRIGLFLVFMISFLACEKNEENISSEKKITINNCTNCHELKGVDYPLIFKGNFEQEISKNNGLFIACQNDNDSIYDFFVLQKDNNNYPEIGIVTELYLYKDAFYVKSNNIWLMFALENVEIEKSFSNIIHPENITYGYGVAHSTEPTTNSKTNGGLSGYISRFISSTTTCDSGGEGSSSCSISIQNQSCNVECSYGYYACCNARVLGGLSCKCYKK